MLDQAQRTFSATHPGQTLTEHTAAEFVTCLLQLADYVTDLYKVPRPANIGGLNGNWRRRTKPQGARFVQRAENHPV